MIDLAALVELQAVDLRVDALTKQIRAIDEQLGDPPGVAALAVEQEAQTERREAMRQARKAIDDEASGLREKIQSEEQKLYGGRGGEARALQNLQEEIYALRRRLKGLDEHTLAAMEREEVEQEAVTYVEGLATASAALWAARQAALQAQRAAVAKDAEALHEEAAAQRAELPAGDLALYDAQRKKRPVAVAASSGGVCGACRLTLPTMVVTRARRAQEPVYCPACACLVYVR